MSRNVSSAVAPVAVSTSNAHAATAVPPRPRDALAALITTEHVSLSVALISLLGAFVLGTFHALAPGHGKTVVAAYLVGSRGTARHAVLLGIIVTLTHTAAVFALGVAVLFASRYVLPERLYPWLGFVSGMMILSIGAWQLVRRWSARRQALSMSTATPTLSPNASLCRAWLPWAYPAESSPAPRLSWSSSAPLRCTGFPSA